MAIVINGSGTVTGISVGGLPDGIVDAGTLATNSVDSAELIDGAVDDSHMAAMAASKLTGALPAISGAALTSLPFKYVGTNTRNPSTTDQSTTNTWVSTGATITIPAADVVGLSKLIIISDGSVRIDKDAHAHADFRWQRTAPSAVNFQNTTVGVVAGGSEAYPQAGSIAIDSSLGTGDHTYTMYCQKANASSSYCDEIYYRWMGWRMVAIGV